MTKQTITAVFDTRDHAESAALSLRQVGIPAADVTLSSEDARDELGAGTGPTAEPRKTGFMASLENMFGGYEDRDTYAEGVRRGGTLLTVHVDDAHIDRAVSLLEQHGAVDLDEREETWRSEGWTGGATQTGAAATGVAGATAAGLATATTTSTATAPRPAASVTTAETRTTAVPAVRPLYRRDDRQGRRAAGRRRAPRRRQARGQPRQGQAAQLRGREPGCRGHHPAR